jgi:NADPH2:quinone reductase
MRAQVLKQFGGPENLVLEETPKPGVQPGTLLIKLAATSVNSLDIKIREGGWLSLLLCLPSYTGLQVA